MPAPRRRRSVPLILTAFAVGALVVPNLAVSGASAAALPAAATASTTAAGHRKTAVVSLGDSYIAGEAGRWKGNSASTAPGHLGTDLAWQPSATDPAGTTDPTRVYGATADGCHRSPTAPIRSAHLPFATAINLACSGARTYHVLRASAGGQSFHGEAPQDDQLAGVARQYRVKLIDLSIGGNDLGFGDIVTQCVVAYLFQTTPCSTSQAPVVQQRLPEVAAKVGAVVDDIRATMRSAGYRDRDYRLVVQSYPSPSPAPDRARYSGTAPDERATVGGCPFLDVDSEWARTTVVPALSNLLQAVARSHDARFLDLTDAFHGHELCATTDRQSTGDPRAASSEWIRFIDLANQGNQGSESLHPNYFGQQAMGRCLALATFARKDVACHGIAHLPTWGVYLTRAKG